MRKSIYLTRKLDNNKELKIMVNKKENGAVELQNALNQSEAFVLKYKKALLIVVAALAVAVAGFFLYRTYVYLPEEEKASTELAKGQTLFSMEQFEVALNGDKAGFSGFANIAKDHSGTDAGNLANLYAGLCCAQLNKWNDAVTYLEDSSPASDAMVSPAAIAALGNAYAHVGKVDEAISSLKKAASKADDKAEGGANNSLSPTFLLQAGQLLESQNKKAEALELYKDIKKKYQNSALVQSQEIDKYIERASIQ